MVMVTRSKSAGNPDLIFQPKPFVRSTKSLTVPRQIRSHVIRRAKSSALPVHSQISEQMTHQKGFLMEHDYAKTPDMEMEVKSASSRSRYVKKFAILAICLLLLTGMTWIIACRTACSCSSNEPEVDALKLDKIRSRVEVWMETTLIELKAMDKTRHELQAWVQSSMKKVASKLETMATTCWNQTMTHLNKTLTGFPCYCDEAMTEKNKVEAQRRRYYVDFGKGNLSLSAAFDPQL